MSDTKLIREYWSIRSKRVSISPKGAVNSAWPNSQMLFKPCTHAVAVQLTIQVQELADAKKVATEKLNKEVVS
jgi:hypothetical protein